MTTSKIDIIMDDTFKQFIRQLKQEVDINALRSSVIEYILPCQEEIRQYIYKNQNKINKNISIITKKSHPELFAIFISIICSEEELDTMTSFQEVLNISNERGARFDLALYSSENPESIETTTCCCNHLCRPQNLFLVRNRITGLYVAIGCDCAEKKKFIEPEKMRKLKRERENNYMYMNMMIKDKENKKGKEWAEEQRLALHLSLIGETKKSVKKRYHYLGGTFGPHQNVIRDPIINNQIKEMQRQINEAECNGCLSCTREKIFIVSIEKYNPLKMEMILVCESCYVRIY